MVFGRKIATVDGSRNCLPVAHKAPLRLDDRQAFARGEIWQHGAFTKVLLDARSADDIDTDCNGVITMADLTVTMTTTRRRPLSQEEIEALIDLRIAQLRVLAAQTAVDW